MSAFAKRLLRRKPAIPSLAIGASITSSTETLPAASSTASLEKLRCRILIIGTPGVGKTGEQIISS